MPFEGKFWFLDVSEEEGVEGPEIWVWGIMDDGKRCVLIDRGHRQRLYLLPEPIDAEEAREDLNSRIKSSNLRAMARTVKKKRLGRVVDVIEVSCHPMDVESLLDIARRLFGGDAFYEDDIRFSNRYLLDEDISPSSWYTGRFQEVQIDRRDGVDSFQVLEGLRGLEEDLPLELRVLGFDVIYVSERGEADPKRDPVAVISVHRSDGRRHQFTLDIGEGEVLMGFTETVRNFNPDVVVGYASNSIHWNYLLKRAEKSGVHLGVGRLRGEPHQSLHGHFSILGRINFDLKEYVDEIAAIQKKNLEELLGYLGVKATPVESVDPFYYTDYWKGGDDERKALLEYSSWRAENMVRTFLAVSEEVFSTSSITGIPADYVQTASQGSRLENYLMREAVRVGELIPKARRRRRRPRYIGGRVLSPKPGLHENVASIDFKSMYPSLMLKHNISPDTVVRPPYRGEVFTVGEVGVGIIQDRRGFFFNILRRILEEREEVRKRMEESIKDSHEYRLLDSRQGTLKIMANAMYGYMGWTGARWYVEEGASATAALGRKAIDQTVNRARELGLKVIYGDTDSLFTSYDPEKVQILLDWIEKDLGLEAKLEKVYDRIIFTEAKKRYAGLTRDGEMDVVGLEMVRRDWSNYAKETQRGLLEIVLGGRDLQEAMRYIRERIEGLRRKDVDLMDLLVEEQITRPLEEYKVRSSHIAVAQQLVEEGWHIKKGDYVGYVITVGEGPLYGRAVHYSKASMDELDIEYYIEKQVIPVCSRILAALGVSGELNLVSGMGADLESFMGGEID